MKLTEKEKCLLGQLYDANYDAELIAERTKCKDLCFRYNQLLPSRIEEGSNCFVNCWERPERTFSSNNLSIVTTAITSTWVKTSTAM